MSWPGLTHSSSLQRREIQMQVHACFRYGFCCYAHCELLCWLGLQPPCTLHCSSVVARISCWADGISCWAGHTVDQCMMVESKLSFGLSLCGPTTTLGLALQICMLSGHRDLTRKRGQQLQPPDETHQFRAESGSHPGSGGGRSNREEVG